MTTLPALAAPLLVDKVGEETARRLLARLPRGIRFWWAQPAPGAGGAVPLELVRLPVAVARALPGASRSRGRARRMPAEDGASRIRLYVVERVLGHAWALSFEHGGAEAGDDGARSTGGADGAGPLPARLGIEDCRKPLAALAVRATFAFGRGRVTDATELGPPGAASYPFWLRYRRDRRGRIDFAVLDAVSGLPAGSAVRAAIAAALIDADRE